MIRAPEATSGSSLRWRSGHFGASNAGTPRAQASRAAARTTKPIAPQFLAGSGIYCAGRGWNFEEDTRQPERSFCSSSINPGTDPRAAPIARSGCSLDSATYLAAYLREMRFPISRARGHPRQQNAIAPSANQYLAAIGPNQPREARSRAKCAAYLHALDNKISSRDLGASREHPAALELLLEEREPFSPFHLAE